jgi:D-alanine-D-alanine ligase
MDKSANILVICGGVSTEREISLKSGQCVYNALVNKGYKNVRLFDLTFDNLKDVLSLNPDIAFLALHGKGGEDGSIQGMLELARIPYTGPGITCSAVCMDKIMTKRILENAGLPTPKFVVRRKDECVNYETVAEELIHEIKLPMVLKSPCQGSSIGVVIVKKREEMIPAIQEVFKYGSHLLAEQFVDGTEVTLPILGNDKLTVFPIIEITSEREFYDYTAKYTRGLCHHIIPACIESSTAKEITLIGERAYKVLNCTGLSRIDFIVDREKGPMVIEVNTLPGMTDMSLFPDAARYIGISYEELVERILDLGYEYKRELRD